MTLNEWLAERQHRQVMRMVRRHLANPGDISSGVIGSLEAPHIKGGNK